MDKHLPVHDMRYIPENMLCLGFFLDLIVFLKKIRENHSGFIALKGMSVI